MYRKNKFKAIVAIAVALAFVMPGAVAFANIEETIDRNISSSEVDNVIDLQTLDDDSDIETPEPLTVDWWPMFHHDPTHSGYSTSTAPDTANLLWNFTTGGEARGSPVVVDGKVFFPSFDNNFYCLDLDGNELWNFSSTGASGGVIYASSAVYDGMVFFGSHDGNIYCLDTDGNKIWNYTVTVDIGGTIYTLGTLTAPAVVDGKVYIATMGYMSGRVYCLDMRGDVIWQYTTGGQMYSSPAVVDGKVFIGSDDDNMYCLDADTGAFIWSYTTGDNIYSAPAVADGKVFFGSWDGNFYCLDMNNGNELWNYTTGSMVLSSPAVADGKVFFGSYDQNVYCLDMNNGNKLWNYTIGASVAGCPSVADGKVYIGCHSGNFYCLDMNNGNELWNYTTGDRIYGAPAIADGKVFIGSWDDNLYCFGEAAPDITWDATLSFSETGGASTNPVIFGEAPDACDGPTGPFVSGNDKYDMQMPPAGNAPYIRSWFDDGLLSPFHELWGDYRQGPDTFKVWNLSVKWVDSLATDVTISWDTTEIDDSEYNSVVLYDVSNDIVVANMLIDTECIFTAEIYYPGPPGQFHKAFQIIAAYETYTLTTDTDGTGVGTVTPPSGSVYEPYDVVTLTATPDPVSSDFIVWTGDVDDPTAATTTITMDGPKTVIATFNLKEYALTTDTDGTGVGTVTPPSGSVYDHGAIVTLTATPDPVSSDFIVWTGDVDDPTAATTTITMDGPKTVIATFNLKEYALTTDTDGTGVGTVTPPSGSVYDHGAIVTLTATPDFKSDFIVWTGDVDDPTSATTTITMDGAKTVIATFNLKEYALTATVDPSGSGSVILNPPGGIYEHGTVVTLTAEPATNWVFIKWTGDVDDPNSATTTITMDGPKTVTAWFVQGWDATLKFSANIPSTRTDNITIGESGQATDGIDILLDIPKPPAPNAPYLYAYIKHESLPGTSHDILWKECRLFPSPTKSRVWDIYVDIENKDSGTTWVTITWDIAEIESSQYKYVGLHDGLSDVYIRNMKNTNHYSFLANNECEQYFKIVCSNICPEALNDGPYTVNEATTLYVSAEDGVLVNDVDDGLPGPLTAHLADDVSSGNLILNADGSFIYTPNLGSVVPDSFTYTAFDGLCHSDPAIVTITVIQLNHIAILKGWNLISNPVDEPINKADIIVRYNSNDWTWDQAVACNIIVKYIYGWDVDEYTFEDILVPGEGYWIWSNQDCEFLIPSNVVPDNHITYLDASWNLVGLPNDIDLAKTALSIQYLGRYYTWDQAVSDGYIIDFVYGWDRINQNYILSDIFDLGYGYWVYSYVDCALKIS